MTRHTFLITLLLVASAASAFAQSPATPPKFYKLDFSLRETEAGKVTATRSFALSVATHSQSSLRAGGRVAVANGSSSNFVDVGLSVDIKAIEEMEGGLVLVLTADLSNLEAGSPGGNIQQHKWQGTVLVLGKKPVPVFSADSISGKGSVQLEVAATPVAKLL